MPRNLKSGEGSYIRWMWLTWFLICYACVVIPYYHSHDTLTPSRVVHAASAGNSQELSLSDGDLRVALEGFSPASLRNVTLHKAGETGWRDVGGLHTIRKTLVETLQWPSKVRHQAHCGLRCGIQHHWFLLHSCKPDTAGVFCPLLEDQSFSFRC